MLKHAAATAALLLMAPAALGWGETGHRAAGAIAQARLSDEAAAEVRRLLEGQTLADASTWADQVRRDPAYRWSAPLHYINGPRDGEDLNRERDCPDGNCVVGAVDTYTALLADTSKPDQERAEALRWLIHFVQDLHQPLHGGFADDRGGNSIRVTFMGEPTNLHRLWDSGLIEADCPDGWEVVATKIALRIDDRLEAEAAVSTDPLIWADESYDYTRLHLYPDAADADTLGKAYLEAHIDTVYDRLAHASIRLADLLNRVLAGG